MINKSFATAAETPPPTGVGRPQPAEAGGGQAFIIPEILPEYLPRRRRRRRKATTFERYDPSAYGVDAVLDHYIGRATAEGRRLCPWHGDSDPSLTVAPDGVHCKCWSCGKVETAIGVVMFFEGCDFLTAKDKLRGMVLGPPVSAATRRPRSSGPVRSPTHRDADRGEPEVGGVDPRVAMHLVFSAEMMLWRDDLPDDSLPARWRRYLRARRLTDQTIREARLGLLISQRWRGWKYRPSGILIPQFGEEGQVTRLAVRQPKGAQHKYLEMYTGSHSIYPGPSSILPGRPLIVCEGQFDCMLLRQELGGICGVITTGSTANQATDDIIELARAASIVYAAHDADPSGEDAAREWLARLDGAVRMWPPRGLNDWTDAAVEGVRLGEFWRDVFEIDGVL